MDVHNFKNGNGVQIMAHAHGRLRKGLHHVVENSNVLQFCDMLVLLGLGLGSVDPKRLESCYL